MNHKKKSDKRQENTPDHQSIQKPEANSALNQTAEAGKIPAGLYLIGTPIGNLEDITVRAKRILSKLNVLYCEDTRRTRQLLNALKIEGPHIESFHEHSTTRVLQKIGEQLRDGLSVGYVSDAGMPVVSDPGTLLVQLARKLASPVHVIPGPTAVTTFFTLAGQVQPKFLFHGFFPRTRGEIERVLDQLKTLPMLHVFYESPYRVVETLEIFEKNIPMSHVYLGRELTKAFEEFIEGTPKQALAKLNEKDRIRGEFVVGVMGGFQTTEQVFSEGGKNLPIAPAGALSHSDQRDLSLRDRQLLKSVNLFEVQKSNVVNVLLNEEQQQILSTMLQSGMSSKDIAKEMSKKWGLSRRELYEFIVKRLT